jgi:hypothetical protein
MNTIRVARLWRRSVAATDELTFEDGLNLLVGPPNSGKSKWLQTLDWVMGDTGSPDDALSAELAGRFSAMGADVRIGDHLWKLERRTEQGTRGRILVNDRAASASEFSDVLLDELGLRHFRFPRGDPRTSHWVDLSWRMLFRHMYRTEFSWAELAARQPDYEQHAALITFLNISSQFYGEQNQELVRRREEHQQLHARREQFGATLNEIAREVIFVDEASVAITPDSLREATDRLDAAIEEQESRKRALVESLTEPKSVFDIDVAGITARLAVLRGQLSEAALASAKGERRLVELDHYVSDLESEIRRWKRAELAGRVLGPLKVTHCPVCDRGLRDDVGEGDCPLCARPFPVVPTSLATQRVDFEQAQLDEEHGELGQLRQGAQAVHLAAQATARSLADQVSRLEAQLRPTMGEVFAIVPPAMALIDQEIGRLAERRRQTERLARVLTVRDALDRQIDAVRHEITRLEAEAATLVAREVSVAQAETALADGMNTYLNALGRERWNEPEVTCEIRNRSFLFRVGSETWSARLGATLKAYFVVAYQYGLMSLIANTSYAFPGLVILDFPPNLAQSPLPAGAENYLVEPFLALAARLGTPTQVIAASNALSIKGARTKKLDTIWR